MPLNTVGQPEFTSLRSVAMAPRTTMLEEHASFEQALGRARNSQGRDDRTPEQKSREAAEQLVATALVQPIFKKLRETNNAVEPFKPNAAERSFRQLMDAGLAQKMVKSRSWALVDRVADQLLKKASLAGASPAANQGTTP